MKYWYINLKSITLSERGHAPKTTIVGFHLCEMSKKGNFIETESRSMVASGQGEKVMRTDCQQDCGFFGDDENVWNPTVVMVAQPC